MDSLALIGGIGGFFNQMRKDNVVPDIKTLTLLLETASPEPLQEKVNNNSQWELKFDILQDLLLIFSNYQMLIEYADKFGVQLDIDFFNLLIRKRQLRYDKQGAKARGL